MIKAQELRINNIINWHGREVVLEGVTKTYLTSDQEDDVLSPEDAEPIPLTSEWLERFGFEKLPHWTITNSMMINIRNDIFLVVGSVGTPNVMVFIQEFIGDETEDLICIFNYDYHGELTVHRLQNIFQSLTGSELQLKDKTV